MDPFWQITLKDVTDFWYCGLYLLAYDVCLEYCLYQYVVTDLELFCMCIHIFIHLLWDATRVVGFHMNFTK